MRLVCRAARWRGALLAAAVLCTTIGVAGVVPRVAMATTETNDEIHVDYGDAPGTSMWVHWHGPDAAVDYGTTTDYGSVATASAPTITPVDTAGPFYPVELIGPTPDTTYHYRIGAAGLDHTFKTAPTGDFVWDDIGDTGTTLYDPAATSSCHRPWMADVWQDVAADQPDFVTHGGDIG